MFTLTITGRNRRTVAMDAAGEPVVAFDQTPMKLTVSGPEAAKAEARFLTAELFDAPNATIEVDGDPTTRQPLHDWLAGHGAVAPKAKPPEAKPAEAKPVKPDVKVVEAAK